VKVEGISLVLNYRDQFRSILASGGPEKLLAALKRKNAENAENAAKVAS
jgi:ABC-type transporter MlaC component